MARLAVRLPRFTRPALPALLAHVLLAVPAAEARAQQATLRGTVTAATSGGPIAGATVSIAGLNLSVLTGDRGTFTLVIPPARIPAEPVTVSARAIGYRALHRTVLLRAGDLQQDFALPADINRLEEVVVTGMIEEVERAKVPFSVGRLNTADLVVPSFNPIQALQGKIAGVRVASTSGKPGAAPEILLRGPTSVNGAGRGLGPLVIVDDAILNVGGLQDLGGLDIASIEVVKGAAGASLYGTRAANGVITIRTHRGLTGRDGVEFQARTEFGFSDFNVDWGLPRNHTMQLDETGTRYCVQLTGERPCSRTLDWMTELLRINNILGDTVRTPQTIVNAAPAGEALRNVFQVERWPGRYYNPAAQLLTRNPTWLSAVDASGRVGTVSYFVSGQYTSESGAVRNLGGAQSRRGRVNLDYQPRDDLRISISTLYSSFSDDLRTTAARTGAEQSAGIFSSLLLGTRPATDQLARDTLGRLLRRTGGVGLGVTANGGNNLGFDSETTIGDRTANRFLG